MLKILMKGKIETVTADRIKSAHIGREPDTSSTQKRLIQPKPISMAKKPAAIARKPRTTRARSWSMITSTLSLMLGVGTGPAIAPRSNTTGAQLPEKPANTL